MSLDKKVRYQTYKNAIESTFQNMSAMEDAADEDEKDNASKVKDLWDKVLKNDGHSLSDLKGEMNQLSTMQGKGSRLSGSVQNTNIRLFVCNSVTDQTGKFLDNVEGEICPFFVYAKRISGQGKDGRWQIMYHNYVQKNCPYHSPGCASRSRNMPVKNLKMKMQGILTGSDSLGTTELGKCIRYTPKLNIDGTFTQTTIRRAKLMVRADADACYTNNFNKIPAFCTEFERLNEGSIATFDVDNSSKKFESLVVVPKLPLCILDEGGIPSAAVDGAHSKHNRYGGCFISVTGREAWLGKNLTMAIMIAPTESYKSYDTLARVLKHNFSAYKSILDKSYILWSDRDKGKYSFLIITR